MEKIDWSKAPEGATHHMAESSTDYECWLKKQGAKWLYMRMNGKAWMKAVIDDDSLRTITERPSPAWSGEGLPPVGVVCECHLPGELTNNYSWVEAKVIWHNGPTECAVVRSTSRLAWCDEFRPIRTPEQIAADEREAAIEHMIRTYLDGAKDHRGGIRALYDAGYRKQADQ